MYAKYITIKYRRALKFFKHNSLRFFPRIEMDSLNYTGSNHLIIKEKILQEQLYTHHFKSVQVIGYESYEKILKNAQKQKKQSTLIIYRRLNTAPNITIQDVSDT